MNYSKIKFLTFFAIICSIGLAPINDAYAAVDTWTDATTTNVGSTQMRAVSMTDASNGVAVGYSGKIVRTTNGGVTWTAAATFGGIGGSHINGVSMSDASNGVAVGYHGKIVFTTNGGVDWTAATTTNVGTSIVMYGVSMSDASNGVAVGSTGTIVYTSDGGVTWTAAATTNVGTTNMYGVSMSDASNGVAVGASGQIVFTTNGGVVWTDAATTNVGITHMRAVSMSDASNGVAVGDSGQIVFTTNGGVDWTAAATTNVGTTNMYGVSMSDASNGVAVGASGQIVFTVIASSDSTTTSSSDCYDCKPPVLQSSHITILTNDYVVATGDDIIHITANVGDKVTILLNVTDNKFVDTIPFAGIYTNYQEKPVDMSAFYANNYDKWKHTSTSFYEWNVRSDDVAYDYDGTVSWSDNTPTVVTGEITNENYFMKNDNNVLEYFMMPFTFTINEHMQTSQITAKIYDAAGNRLHVTLPVTLQTAGNDPLNFDHMGKQKVLGFYDESVLSEMVQTWSESESNTKQLSSLLGISDESLPAWSTNLATWVAEGTIDSADLIVAVEYLINQ